MKLLVTCTLKNTLRFFLLIVLLNSCSIQKRHYQTGYYINYHNHSTSINSERTKFSKELKKDDFQKLDLTANLIHTDSLIKEDLIVLPTKLNTPFFVKSKANSTTRSKQKIVAKKINQTYKTSPHPPPPGLIDFSFILYAIGGLGAIFITALIITKVPLIIVAVVFVFFCLLLIGIYFLMKHFDLI